MKKFIKVFLFILLAGALNAQNHSYKVYLKNDEKVPEIQTEIYLENQQSLSSTSFNHYSYQFIQFYDIPSAEITQQLNERGILLLQYIPNYTYIAAIPISLQSTDLAKYNIRSIFPFQLKNKLDKKLWDKNIPSYALVDNKYVQLNISYFNNIKRQLVITELRKDGYTIQKSYNHINILTIEIPKKDINKVARLPFVSYVSPIDPPSEHEDLLSRTLGRSNSIASNSTLSPFYNGKGVDIALQDDGHIGPHIDYKNRVIKDYCPPNLNRGNHGDHVAGIIMGAGNKDPDAKGMAYGAGLYLYAVDHGYQAFDSMYTHYYSDNIRITSTSYSNGCNAGYNALARRLDKSVRQLPKIMHVFSAGNEGSKDCGYGVGFGWGNITGGSKMAKNTIAVANLDYKSNLSSSSSRGPATDGRLKPDISAMGSSVYSTLPDNTYGYKSGTSMSCPAVSGTLAQLDEAYKDIYNKEPTSDIIKAALLNGADDIGNKGPDFKYGWGRVNARNSYQIIKNNQIIVDSITNGVTETHTIQLPSNVVQLKVMLYWNDYEATVFTSKDLVNDLDLKIDGPSNKTWLPWVLNPYPDIDSLNKPAIRAVDSLNNAEQVTINNPSNGTYTIQVKGNVVPQAPQNYVIVYQFIKKEITVTYPNGLEGLKPGSTETIRWDAYETNNNFKLSYSTDAGQNWQNIASNVPGNQHYYDWQVPNNITGKALIKVEKGSISDISDTTFSIIAPPGNLKFDWVCPDSLKFSWDNVSGATAYEIYKLGNLYMDSVNRVNTNAAVLQLSNPYTVKWLSVKSLGLNDAESKRAIAIETPLNVFNCNLSYDLIITDIANPVNGTINNCFDLSKGKIALWVNNKGTKVVNNYILNYQINSGTIHTDTVNMALQPGDSTKYTFSNIQNFNSVGTHNIKSWLSIIGANSNPYDDTTLFEVYVKHSQTISAPYNINFDNWASCGTASDCDDTKCRLYDGWVNEKNTADGDDIDWRVNKGATPSNGTGPSGDYNTQNGSGKYLYLEASDCFSKMAYLYSPCIDLTQTQRPYLAFAYHMSGAIMGSLHIDAFVNGEWQKDIFTPISGNQGNIWHTDTISLTNYNGKVTMLRFRGKTGTGFTSDIAIDDISILDISLGVEELNKNDQITIHPNPANNELNIKLSNSLKNSRIQLFNSAGKIFFNAKYFKTQYNINLSDVPNGFYFVKIKAKNHIYYRKLVIQH